jgi:holo-[acyl-carrier protein] synthase
MIKGVGMDLVQISRMEKNIANEHFLQRVFTAAEREHIGQGVLSAERAAGCYAVKEALAKALGCGLSGCAPDEVETTHLSTGAPQVQATGKARASLDLLAVQHIWVSISHDAGVAAAVVVLEGE